MRPELGLYMVADGMGGHAAGEVASRMVVDAVSAFINETREADVNRTWPFPYDANVSLDANRLKAALRLANRRLATAMDDDEALRGMATTAAALLFDQRGQSPPVVAHVGDSRVYRIRGSKLEQLTQDHSWVSEQIRAGTMTETDARRHPWRNVVTRALAGGEDPEIEVADVEVQANDRFLICSDGLSGVVTADRVEAVVAAGGSLDKLCQALIDAANEAGGPDNITVTMLQVDVD